MTPRQEALKAYLISMMADGTFRGIKSPAMLLKRATAVFGKDVPVVLGDVLNNVAESGLRNLGVLAMGKAEQLAHDVAKRGLRSVWDEFTAQYDRGAERLRKKR